MPAFLRVFLVLIMAISVGAPAFAQEKSAEKSPPKMRAKVVSDADSGTRVARPDGWVSGKAGKGVVATFRPAGDSKSQIEVRVSPHVKEKQAESFFTSFHSNLQKAGFTKVEVRKDAIYGDKEGLETEYETAAKKSKFRLIVWQYQHKDSAYLVVGFFPAKKRDKYYEDFKQVIENLSFE